MANNEYQKAIKEAQAQIDSTIAKMQMLDKEILSTSKSARKLGAAMKSSGMAELGKIISQQTKLLSQMNTKINRQTKLNSNLAASKRKLNQAAKKTSYLMELSKLNAAKFNREVKEQAILTSKAAGAFDKLNVKLKQSKRAYMDALASGKATAAQLKVLRGEFMKYSMRVNAAKDATANFSKRSLRGMIGGLKQMASAFGIAGAAFLAADLARKSFNLAKRLQALDFALQAVTKTQADFARAQQFVSEISDKYGANILSVTERYTKFLAAAKQSAVSLEDTEKIFGTMTKASGVLGLKTDELTGVYLALEQMMSKGKVTTEELRRQLGERLPGAFGIMADALGVSIPKLDEMLKKGQVMSSEVLPKFAEEVQKAFGLDTYETIETIQAAQNRLTNGFVELVGVFTEGGLSDATMTVMNGIADALQYLRKGLEFVSPYFKELSMSVDFAVESFKNLMNEIDPTGTLLKEIGEIINFLVRSPFTILANTIRAISIGTAGFSRAFQELARTLSSIDWSDPIGSMERMAGVLGRMQDAFQNGVADFEDYKRKMQEAADQEELKRTINETAAAMVMLSKAREGDLDIETARQQLQGFTIEQIREYREHLRGQLSEVKKLTDQKKAEIKAVIGSIAWYDKEIQKREELIEKTALTKEGIKELVDQIKELKKQKETLEVAVEVAEMEDEKVDLTDFMDALPEDAYAAAKEVYDAINQAHQERVTKGKELADEIYEYQAKKAHDQYLEEKRLADQRIELFNTLFSTFGEYYDIDLEKFTKLIDEKENTTADWVDATVEAGSAYLNARLQVYDVEMQEAIRSRDLILNNELSTEEQKEEARRKFREEESRIRTERAKAERENTLIQIAIDTAAAVVKATAQTGVLSPFVIPGIIALGAAQAAIVASQPLPRFEKGHLAGTHEGPALINDANRSDYREVVKRRDGGIEVYKDRNQVIDMKKGDKVYKSMADFSRSHNISDVVMMNIMSDSSELSLATSGKMISEVSMMRRDLKTTWGEMQSLAKRPVNVNVRTKVEMPKKRKYL